MVYGEEGTAHSAIVTGQTNEDRIVSAIIINRIRQSELQESYSDWLKADIHAYANSMPRSDSDYHSTLAQRAIFGI